MKFRYVPGNETIIYSHGIGTLHLYGFRKFQYVPGNETSRGIGIETVTYLNLMPSRIMLGTLVCPVRLSSPRKTHCDG